MTLVSVPEPPGDSEPTTEPDGREPPPAPAPAKSRRPWIWLSGVMAVVAAGLLVWALTIQSDLDSTQQQLDSTQQELADTQQTLDSTSKALDSAKQDLEELGSQLAEDDSHPGVALAAGKVLYDEFSEKLDAARGDLAANEQALADAEKATAQAEKDAAAAQQAAAAATDETAKANAEAEQAMAEAEAAESRAAAAAACAKSYISAFGGLFEGENPQDQADAVREELTRITAGCSDDLGAD